MVRKETLRAVISASVRSFTQSVRSATKVTDRFGDEMRDVSLNSASLAESMDFAESETDELRNALAQGALTAQAFAGSQELVAEAEEDAAQEARHAALSMALYEEIIDKTGLEASEAAGQNLALASSLRAVGAAAGEASVNVGPFNTSVRRAVIALPLLIGLTGSLLAVLGGITVAAGAAGGALLGIFAGGLVSRAEDMAAASEDLENRSEALVKIFKNFGNAVDEATSPLQDLAAQDAAMDTLSALVTIIGDVSKSMASLRDDFAIFEEELSAIFWAEEAQGIAEIEKAVEDLLPMLVDLTAWILQALPDLISWLRTETLKTGPAFADFAQSVLSVTVELAELGGTILRILLPPLAILLDILRPLLDLFTRLPDYVYDVAIAFGVAAVAAAGYSKAVAAASIANTALVAGLAPLIKGLKIIAAALGTTATVVAAVIAAIVLVISYFNLWDDAINGVKTVLRELFLLMIEWVEFLQQPIEKMKEFLGLANDVNEVEVDVPRELRESPSASERAQGQGSPGARGAAQRAREAAQTGSGAARRARELRRGRTEYNFDFRGADLGGSSEREIERVVERALKRQQSKTNTN